MHNESIEVSKFLSLVLRHKPEVIGLTLTLQGWVFIEDLLAAAKAHGKTIKREVLDEVVFTNDKKRFAFSADGLSIRANQGHSVDVDLELTPQLPPKVLYHGTATRVLSQIKTAGLLKMDRQHVHLSAHEDTATRVGARHGKPIVLIVNTEKMSGDGIPFFLSLNGVWLTEHVPSQYINATA
jgi:putative RNA 2'-phosphotransferase